MDGLQRPSFQAYKIKILFFTRILCSLKCVLDVNVNTAPITLPDRNNVVLPTNPKNQLKQETQKQ